MMEKWEKVEGSPFINKRTLQLLEMSEQYYEAISVETSTDLIPSTKTFPFGVKGSIFGGNPKVKTDWPAIWEIAKTLELGGGAGNSHQRQIISDHGLVPTVYHFKNGEWYYLLTDKIIKEAVSDYDLL
jgi:hypothetical protein